jgi:hypothetical protein
MKFGLIFIGLLFPGFVLAQTDTGMSLIGDVNFGPEKVQNAFKTSRVINLQSIEVTDPGVLDVKINHRFGTINQGAYEGFGLDNAQVRIGAEYGIMSNLALNFGRSSLTGMLDAGLKYRIMHQTSDNAKPLSVLVYAGTSTGPVIPSFRKVIDYVGQVIIGRKISEGFSLQLAPSYVTAGSSYKIMALGIGMRQKITTRTTLNLEYIPIFSKVQGVRNSLSVGVDIETGGHVFQLHLTNSTGMAESMFIARTANSWLDGGIHFGFNISRVFTVVSPTKFSYYYN